MSTQLHKNLLPTDTMYLSVDTYANLKANQGISLHFGFATDLQILYFYTNIPSLGDGGWIPVGG